MTVDADRVAERTLAVPGVAALHGGQFGEVATYLPGRRVHGVALTDTECSVHIVVAYPNNVCDVARSVHLTVAPLLPVPVTVTVEDVTVEDVTVENVTVAAGPPNSERTPR